MQLKRLVAQWQHPMMQSADGYTSMAAVLTVSTLYIKL